MEKGRQTLVRHGSRADDLLKDEAIKFFLTKENTAPTAKFECVPERAAHSLHLIAR